MEDVPQLAVQDFKIFPKKTQNKHHHSTHRTNRILHIASHLPHERQTSDVYHLKPTLQIIRAIKLPTNQKRETTTGKKRLKGHGPGHT